MQGRSSGGGGNRMPGAHIACQFTFKAVDKGPYRRYKVRIETFLYISPFVPADLGNAQWDPTDCHRSTWFKVQLCHLHFLVNFSTAKWCICRVYKRTGFP